MKLRILSQKEFTAGLVFMAIGGGWAVVATGYPLGTALHMGPGYFPFAVSIALAVMGLCSVIRALSVVDAETIGRWPLVAIVMVLASLAVFSLLLNRLGLVAASLALILISSYAQLRRGNLRILVYAVCVSGFAGFLFVYLLGLPIRLY